MSYEPQPGYQQQQQPWPQQQQPPQHQQWPQPPLQAPKKSGHGCITAFVVVMVLVILASVAIAIGASNQDDDEGDTAAGTTGGAGQQEENPTLFPGRVDAQSEDEEREVGGPEVAFSGYRTVVTAASFQQSISEFETAGYIVADVTVRNNDASAQAYNLFDWSIQTPGGQVVGPTFTTIDGMLQSGDLVSQGTVSGKVVFEVGDQRGDFFLIYKPDPFDAARGIWKVTAA